MNWWEEKRGNTWKRKKKRRKEMYSVANKLMRREKDVIHETGEGKKKKVESTNNPTGENLAD